MYYRSIRITAATLMAAAAVAAHAAGNLDRGDTKFVTKAAEGGMFEVEVSKLAADKASDPEVKSFAQMLVDHHTKANDELKQVASAKSIVLPAELPRDKRSKIEKLSKKSGAEFDRDYINQVGIDAHKTDVKLFKNDGEKAKDADVKAFATKTLPTLEQHLAAAQKLKDEGKAKKS